LVRDVVVIEIGVLWLESLREALVGEAIGRALAIRRAVKVGPKRGCRKS
jgi:hypothetical protein